LTLSGLSAHCNQAIGLLSDFLAKRPGGNVRQPDNDRAAPKGAGATVGFDIGLGLAAQREDGGIAAILIGSLAVRM
jgi:hypothetical protein